MGFLKKFYPQFDQVFPSWFLHGLFFFYRNSSRDTNWDFSRTSTWNLMKELPPWISCNINSLKGVSIPWLRLNLGFLLAFLMRSFPAFLECYLPRFLKRFVPNGSWDSTTDLSRECDCFVDCFYGTSSLSCHLPSFEKIQEYRQNRVRIYRSSYKIVFRSTKWIQIPKLRI